MALNWVHIAQGAGWVVLAAALTYLIWKFYSTRADFTYMTHNDRGFKRALKGRGIIWDIEEFIVKGPAAPRIEFVALDPASGQRRMNPLLDSRTGAVNLRPQYCVPLPFTAITSDNHKMTVEARVQFSLNRERMFFVYHVQDFGLALETRIQSALRAEIGKRQDEDMRAALRDIEDGAVNTLRTKEAEGDEAHEVGVALGVTFHHVSFNYVAADEFGAEAFPTTFAAPGEVAMVDKPQPAPAENLVQLPLPGEILYFYDPSTGAVGAKKPVGEIVVVYGRGVTLRAHEGVPTHCALFARIAGDWKYAWPKFALECRKCRWEGPQLLRIERAE